MLVFEQSHAGRLRRPIRRAKARYSLARAEMPDVPSCLLVFFESTRFQRRGGGIGKVALAIPLKIVVQHILGVPPGFACPGACREPSAAQFTALRLRVGFSETGRRHRLGGFIWRSHGQTSPHWANLDFLGIFQNFAKNRRLAPLGRMP